MKQKLLNKLWLRVGMIVAIMTTALSGTAWAESVVINTTNFTKPNSGSGYAAYDGTRTISGVDVTSSNVMVQSGNLQFKRSFGYLYNSTAMPGNITKITLGTATNFTIYVGTTANSETQTVTSGSAITGNYTFFKVKCGSSTGTTATITIEYSTGGTPTPSLSVSPASIAFGEKAINGSYEKTFNVSFANLTENLTVSGFSGVTVSPTTISKDATSPATVTVTYAPTAEGSINGNITVSNTADEVSQTVAVTGSAYDPSNITYYEKVTKAPSNWTGDYIFTGINSDNYYALTGVNSNLGTAAAVTVTEDGIAATPVTNAYKVIIAQTTNGYSLYMDGVGYLSYSGSNNQLHASDEFEESTCEWTISFASGVATITNVGVAGRMLQFNYNSGNPRFACYTSSQVKLTLFKLNDGTPSISADNVSITYDAMNGSIAYTLNNATGNVTATVTDGDWLTLGEITSSEVPFTCTANPNNTPREATVTLLFSGADNKVVTVTQAAAPVTYTTIPALFDKATEVGSTATDVNVTFNNWVVSGVHNNNVFLTDNQGNGLIIYTSDHGFAVNDKLSGTVSETPLKLYNGSAEFTNLTASTSGLTVTKDGEITVITNKTIAELGGVNTGAVITLSNLTYDGTNLSDGTNTIKPYNSLYSEMSLTSGKSYNITGVYQQFSETKEILPRSAADIEEYEDNRAEAGLAWSASEVNIELNASDGDYTLPTLTNPNSLTVTYESSDENVAIEVNGTILVETSAVGTATITASFAGNDDYKPASVSYTISVYDPNVKGTIDNPYTVADVEGQAEATTFGDDIYVTGYIVGCVKDNKCYKTTNDKLVDTNLLLADTPDVSYTEGASVASNTDGLIPVELPSSPSSIRENWGVASNNVIGYKVILKGNAQAYFGTKAIKGTSEISAVSVPAKFNTSGYATFSSNYAVSIPADGAFTAWQITNIDNDNKITFVQVTGNVKAETGLFLKGTASDEITIEVAASGEELQDNILVGFPNATDVTAGEYYGLSGNQFVKVNAGTVKAGKALLPAGYITESSGVKPFTFVFEDDATGISLMEDGRSQMEDGVIYNLAGQRLDNSQFTIHNSQLKRGIYIVNGKKILK